MIKGWRNSPGWISIYEARAFNRTLLRQQAAAVMVQENVRALQQAMYEENARHNAECHARKVEAGEIAATASSH